MGKKNKIGRPSITHPPMMRTIIKLQKHAERILTWRQDDTTAIQDQHLQLAASLVRYAARLVEIVLQENALGVRAPVSKRYT